MNLCLEVSPISNTGSLQQGCAFLAPEDKGDDFHTICNILVVPLPFSIRRNKKLWELVTCSQPRQKGSKQKWDQIRAHKLLIFISRLHLCHRVPDLFYAITPKLLHESLLSSFKGMRGNLRCVREICDKVFFVVCLFPTSLVKSVSPTGSTHITREKIYY